MTKELEKQINDSNKCLVLLGYLKNKREEFSLYTIEPLESSIKLKNFCTLQIKYINNISDIEYFDTITYVKIIETKQDIDSLTGKELLYQVDKNTRVLILKAYKNISRDLYENILDEYITYTKEQLYLQAFDRDTVKFKEVCPICKGTSKVKGEFGVEVLCECKFKPFVSKKKDNKVTKQIIESINIQQEMIDKIERLTGSRDIDTHYNQDTVIQNMREINTESKFTLSGFKKYDTILTNIITSIKELDIKSLNSYLITAPQGCGQQEFVDECLIALVKQGIKAVPYKSLIDLINDKIVYNNNVLRAIQSSEQVNFGYNFWQEYQTADIVFVRLSDMDNKTLESKSLYNLMQERGSRKLPTIVFTSFSLDIYKNDERLRYYYWDNMMNYNNAKETKDKSRLNYVKVYKKYTI